MTSLESKITLQKTRLELLTNAFEYFNNKDLTFSKNQVQTRLEILESNWNKFDKDNDRICESKPELVKDLPYFTEDWFSKAQEAYATNKSNMLDILETLTSRNLSESPNISVQSSSSQRSILPKITLPQFEGDYQSWKTFSDLFTSLVIENSDLSEVSKMHYLKTSLIKEAAQLISSFQVSGDNFSVAWEKLKSRYENKRVLISKHLDDILKLKPINRKTSKSLNHLMSVVNDSLGALKALGSPIDYWDHIIVHIVVSRLDPETHEAWEIHQGTSTDPPTLQELQKFVEGRARALEGIELRDSTHQRFPGNSSFTSKTQGNFSQKAKVHTSSVDQSKSQVACLLCNENHYLSNCNAFSQKSPLQRKEYLVAKNLCFNCLGPHLLRDCHSKKSCFKCKKRHHTLIHEITGKPSSDIKTSIEPQTPLSFSTQAENLAVTESSVGKTVATTNHAVPESTGKNRHVLLATAQVKVTGPKQNTIEHSSTKDQNSHL